MIWGPEACQPREPVCAGGEVSNRLSRGGERKGGGVIGCLSRGVCVCVWLVRRTLSLDEGSPFSCQEDRGELQCHRHCTPVYSDVPHTVGHTLNPPIQQLCRIFCPVQFSSKKPPTMESP